MPEIQESARRWSGYVCPDCRFVFRVARDHDGRGVVCPSCQRLLKLPRPGDPVPPLMAPEEPGMEAREEADDTTPTPIEPKQGKRRRGHRHETRTEREWDAPGTRDLHVDEPGGGRAMIWLAGMSLMGLVAVLAVVIFLKQREPDAQVTLGQETVEEQRGPSAPQDSGPVPRADTVFATEALPVVEAFLSARTVEEVLEWVDEPDVVSGRIRRMYPDGVVDPPGLSELGQMSQLMRNGPHGTLPVRTRNFDIRLITLRDDPAGLKVDWESWVGWSDIPWDQFGMDDAQSSGAFRVILQEVEYYNFGFSDDRKWQSFRLESPDGVHSFYGYAERGSLVHSGLQTILARQPGSRLMLALRHPEGARGRGQVEIERIVSEDWIDPERREKP